MEILQKPVTGEHLFDREDLIQTLTRGDKNYALIGPRKSGKTSLMWEIRPTLEQKDILAPYIYVLFEETDSSFLIRYVNLCLLHFLRKHGRGGKGMVFEDSLETVQEQIEQVLELKPGLAKHLLRLREALGKPPNTGTVEMALKLPSALVFGTDERFIVMIDEFQNLSVLSTPVLDILRKQIMMEAGVNYLVAGSEIGMMKDILESSAAPLFGHFSIHRVAAFTVEQSRHYILGFLKKRGLTIGEIGLSFLVALTGGFPFYINVLLDRMVAVCEERGFKRIPNDVMTGAVEAVSFRTGGTLYIHLKATLEKTFTKRNMGRYLAILKAVALGSHTVSEIAAATMNRTTSLPVYLDFLRMTELLCKTAEGYRLTEPFLEFWLRACLRVQDSMALTPKEKLDAFHNSTRTLLDAVRSQLGRARESQIREMFYLSEEYGETSSGVREGDEFDLITTRGDILILGEIKIGGVTVADVKNFHGKLERVEQETMGYLFVLGSIYPNALTEASERGMEIWDLERVNRFRKKVGLEKLTV